MILFVRAIPHYASPTYTQWNLVWDNLCDFILADIKAKNGVDALVSRSIFNEDSGQNK